MADFNFILSIFPASSNASAKCTAYEGVHARAVAVSYTHLDVYQRQIHDIMPQITHYTKDAVIIMITNPLDVTTYCAAKCFDYPENRLFGTGTTLETLRFKRIIANHYNVDAKDVQGYMLGEHGNSAFPAWSLLNIGGIPADQLDKFFKKSESLDRQEVAKSVVQVAYDVLNCKGYTNTCLLYTSRCV